MLHEPVGEDSRIFRSAPEGITATQKNPHRIARISRTSKPPQHPAREKKQVPSALQSVTRFGSAALLRLSGGEGGGQDARHAQLMRVPEAGPRAPPEPSCVTVGDGQCSHPDREGWASPKHYRPLTEPFLVSFGAMISGGEALGVVVFLDFLINVLW